MRSRLSEQAKSDLGEIRRYIARDNPRAAAKVIYSIRETLRNVISRYPYVGTSCDELASGLRCFPVGNYVVFYLVSDAVDVVRVVHAARDVGAIFRR